MGYIPVIFNHDAFLTAFTNYGCGSADALDDMVILLTPLAEVIASSFSNDEEYRQDLIQECLLRAVIAIPSYNRDVAKPHSYFTSVFRNICITYISRQTKHPLVDIAVLNMERYSSNLMSDVTVLQELIERNRKRFPSIDCDMLDRLSVHIYKYINLGSKPGNSNGVIKSAMAEFDVPRRMATVIYHSTLVWLRSHYIDYAYYGYKSPKEMTVLYDVYELLGEEMYEFISTVFAGLSIKLPK